MFRFKIFKQLHNLFMYPHESDGGSGSANNATAVAGNGGFQPSSDNVEEEFLSHMMANDEDYQKLLKEEAEANKDNKGGENPDGGEGGSREELGSEDGEGDGEKKDDDADGGKKDDGGSQDDSLPPADAKEGDNWLDENDAEYTFKGGKWVKEDGSEFQASDDSAGGDGETDDNEDYEYPDDVIPGLKGKHFASMPKDAQEAIAKYHQDNASYRQAAKTDLEVMNVLKNDPIAKHRLELIRQGKNYAPYQVPDVTKEEISKILETENHEAAAKLINKAAQRIAGVQVDNERLASDMKRKIEESNKKGEQILREAGNLHPDIKKEQRLETFENAETVGHADKEIYDNYHQKIVDFCTNRGYKYSDIAKMKPAELYALVAVNEGWAVAFNTQKRDTKMLTEHTMKALEHFRRSKRGKEVSRGMRTAENTSGKTGLTSPFKIRGIDVVKLANDDGYHEGVLNMKPGNVKWIDEVRELRAKGDEIIERRKRKREQAEKRGSTA